LHTNIEAAGGLVWRRTKDAVEVLLVHRPLRDDWTLPVGRLEHGESIEQCARREVQEETGYTCEIGPLLSILEFTGADDGLVHRFHIFEMTTIRGAFVANSETDEIAWLGIDAAIARTSYENVQDLLRSWRS
jgi:8-oxo-dGTP diphosphatase